MPGIVDVLNELNVVKASENQILLIQSSAATAAQVSAILGFVKVIGAEVDAINAQTQNLQTELNDIAGTVRAIQARIASIPANPQLDNKPVILPTTPPAGYGGASASDVWLYVNPFVGEDSQTMFSELWHWLRNYLTTVDNAGNSPFSILVLPSNYTDIGYASGIVSSFKADLSVVVSSDTLKTWLSAQNPTWTFIGPTNGLLQAQPPAPYFLGFNYYVAWPEAYFQLLKAFQLGTLVPPAVDAPVWPGLAKVTFGSSLALSDGLTIPGPLDGVVIAISGVSPPVGFYPFGAIKSFVKVGGLIFIDDNGQAEAALPIGLEANVVTPRSMARADHAILRLKSGVTGTIKPWIKT